MVPEHIELAAKTEVFPPWTKLAIRCVQNASVETKRLTESQPGTSGQRQGHLYAVKFLIFNRDLSCLYLSGTKEVPNKIATNQH